MPATHSLVALESRLVDHLLDFEHLDAAWPKGHTAIERARIGRARQDALSEIVTLRNRIAGGRAATLADAAAQLRRLIVMADEGPEPHALLAPQGARRLVASVLAVVEREADAAEIGEAAGQPWSTSAMIRVPAP